MTIQNNRNFGSTVVKGVLAVPTLATALTGCVAPSTPAPAPDPAPAPPVPEERVELTAQFEEKVRQLRYPLDEAQLTNLVSSLGGTYKVDLSREDRTRERLAEFMRDRDPATAGLQSSSKFPFEGALRFATFKNDGSVEYTLDRVLIRISPPELVDPAKDNPFEKERLVPACMVTLQYPRDAEGQSVVVSMNDYKLPARLADIRFQHFTGIASLDDALLESTTTFAQNHRRTLTLAEDYLKGVFDAKGFSDVDPHERTVFRFKDKNTGTLRIVEDKKDGGDNYVIFQAGIRAEDLVSVPVGAEFIETRVGVDATGGYVSITSKAKVGERDVRRTGIIYNVTKERAYHLLEVVRAAPTRLRTELGAPTPVGR